MPIISAIICTYKRADYLRQALRSLCEQTLARSEFEVLVVDNAVEAETEQVVREFERTGLPVRYIPEPEVGLNRARNTGLKCSAGRYVAYLDDDARADARWLESLVQAFQSTEAAVVGGRVWLDWHGEKPSWVPERLLAMFTYVDHGDSAHVLGVEYLVGANLAFEKDALNSIGGFDPNLDRQGRILLSGGDTRAVNQLRQNGQVIYYEPAAFVWHSVLQSRKRPMWLLRRMFWDGASQPFLDQLHNARSRRILFRATLRDLRQCLRWLLSAAVATLSGKKTVAFESLLGLSQRAGRVRTELRMLAINPN
jgi:glycosyltransferase involved in cell wall biosynthesis